MEYTALKETRVNEYYLISSEGNILNSRTGHVFESKNSKERYPSFKGYLIHRLVYKYFKGELKSGYVINHIDHNKKNNSIDNLEQVTYKENHRKACEFYGVNNLDKFISKQYIK